MGRVKGIKNKRQLHKWSDEEKTYLEDIVKGRSHKEILDMLNSKFEYQFNLMQVQGAIKRYNLNTGRTGYFEKGREPFNKGTKGLMKPNKTSFQKGDIPANYRPVGSERITRDGYIEVKVADPKTWKLKHRVIYEENYGPLKKGENIIFADGNKLNVSIENLIKVTRRQLLVLNNNRLIKENQDCTETGINVANVIIKMQELKKR